MSTGKQAKRSEDIMCKSISHVRREVARYTRITSGVENFPKVSMDFRRTPSIDNP
jgi:hypothetical protein